MGLKTFLTVVAPFLVLCEKSVFLGGTQHVTTDMTPLSTDTLKADENTRLSFN